MYIDKNYHNLLEKVLKEGYDYEDPNRKGVFRKEIGSYTFKHEFKYGFPAISTKRLAFKTMLTELMWFLKGDTNIKYLVDNNCNIWNKDAYNYYLKNKRSESTLDFDAFIKVIKEQDVPHQINIKKNKPIFLGDLGPIYGYQWVKVNKTIPTDSGHYVSRRVNQIANLIANMIQKPMSSELLVNAWNPVDLDEMSLQPCHHGFQVVMRPLTKIERIPKDKLLKHLIEPTDEELDNLGYHKYGFTLKWMQRSSDLFLGIPLNIASYATLALILEATTGHKALGIEGNLSKVHLYDNSIEAAKEQLSRPCSEDIVKFDCLHWFESLDAIKHSDLGSYQDFIDVLEEGHRDFKLENYNPQPSIKVEMLERNE